jgi:transposase
VHTRGLRELTADDQDLEVMRLLVGRRDELAHLRVQTVNRLHRLLTELIPGGAGKKDLSALQARRMLAGVRPRDVAGATRRRLAADLIGDLEAVDAKLKALKAELRIAVRQNGSTLMDLFGIGPAGAARLLVGPAGRVTRRGCVDPGHRRNAVTTWARRSGSSRNGECPLCSTASRESGIRRGNALLTRAGVCGSCRPTASRVGHLSSLARGMTRTCLIAGHPRSRAGAAR